MSTAHEIMLEKVVTVDVGASVRQAIVVLIEAQIRGAPVVDAERRIVGFVSEYDLILAVHSLGHDGQVAHAMKTQVQTISESTPLEVIAGLMRERNIRRLPVVDDQGRLQGVVSRRDVLRTYYGGEHPTAREP